jgi:hypothetical protein
MNREEPLCSTLVTVTGPEGQPLTFMLSRWRGRTDAVGVELADDRARAGIAGFSASWDPKQRSMRAPAPERTRALRGFFGDGFDGALARWIEASRRLDAVSDLAKAPRAKRRPAAAAR